MYRKCVRKFFQIANPCPGALAALKFRYGALYSPVRWSRIFRRPYWINYVAQGRYSSGWALLYPGFASTCGRLEKWGVEMTYKSHACCYVDWSDVAKPLSIAPHWGTLQLDAYTLAYLECGTPNDCSGIP